MVSKIYVATDSNPVDMQTYELCSDMIDVVIDVSCIYGYYCTAASFFCHFFPARIAVGPSADQSFV